MPRTRPPYPAAFRQQILELAHAGRTPAELSREFNVTAQTISNWVAQDARDR
ncbi:MAG: helix-turn-helix domain-containing protein, partial [Burkholderiales bacterium]|nr:helix-turn-helix domain-containing protein [Burkholderiales bacterium]